MRVVFLNQPDATFPFGVEIVERKGIGHPDTICDALAEETSLALSRYYIEHFGRVLHHNVDKVLLRGGSSRPAFGGGQLIALSEPKEVSIHLKAKGPNEAVRRRTEEIVLGELSRLPDLWKDCLAGRISVY